MARRGRARQGMARRGRARHGEAKKKPRVDTVVRLHHAAIPNVVRIMKLDTKECIMARITMAIEGITPLLCNRFTDEAQQSATSGQRSSAIGDRGTPREQAEKKLYLSLDGETPVIPSPNLLRCIIDAGKFFKAGKSKVTTQKSSLVPACLSIDSVELPISSKEGWETDTRPVRIPSTGGRILAHRPCFHDWKLVVELELNTQLMTTKMLREIIDAAGKQIGLGDFRPDCKGPFGRFVVTQWNVTNGDEE